jgi:flagellar motor switch/type III secretory pathway protein FliN
MPSLGTSSSNGIILLIPSNHDLIKQFSATTHVEFTSSPAPPKQASGLASIPTDVVKFIGQTSLDVNTLFKQKKQQVTTQIKIDPVTGQNQRI